MRNDRGLVAASSVILGGLLASWMTIGKRPLGVIMGFGAGALFSAIAYELVHEAVHIAGMTGFPALGFFGGAFTFFGLELLVDRVSGDGDAHSAAGSSLIVPLVLGIILDGIPESVVIGLGILQGGAVSTSMLVAVFISNLPEAIAATADMRTARWGRGKILLLWSTLAVVFAVASAVGYVFLEGASDHLLAVVQAFAGGAMLMMLANTMIPEAYERARKLAGVATVLGFVASVFLVVLEHSGHG